MARDLETLKTALWEQFEAAAAKQSIYDDSRSAQSYTPSNFAIAGRAAMGALAQAIVAIEAEQRVQADATDQKKFTLSAKQTRPANQA